MNVKLFSTSRQQERAVLVGLALWPHKKEEVESHLDELASLAETAGAIPIKKFRDLHIPLDRSPGSLGSLSLLWTPARPGTIILFDGNGRLGFRYSFRSGDPNKGNAQIGGRDPLQCPPFVLEYPPAGSSPYHHRLQFGTRGFIGFGYNQWT